MGCHFLKTSNAAALRNTFLIWKLNSLLSCVNRDAVLRLQMFSYCTKDADSLGNIITKEYFPYAQFLNYLVCSLDIDHEQVIILCVQDNA